MRASLLPLAARSAGLLAALALLAACASDPPAPLQRESLREVEATVVSVDKTERMVGLRGPDGRVVSVKAGPEVRNFDQIQVGDRVVASFFEAIGFALHPEGPAEGSSVDLLAGRAKPGEQPAAVLGAMVRTTVTIESVDSRTNTVTFRGEDGLVRAIPVQTEEGREFARRLRPGDRVGITYTEALAIRVDPGR
jgi:hypothetical protein